jgi:nucleoside-diphosphate-sugar epimerase
VDLVQEISPDDIVHLAAGYAKGHSAVGISEAVRANYEIPWLLLEGARRTSATFTYTSTYWLREVDGKVLPATAYASSKHALAVMAKFFADTFGVPVTEIVLYDTYGPHDSRDKLVPYLLRCALTEEVARLREPDSLLDLVYVDDVVDGLITMLGSRAREGFHRWAVRSGCAIEVDQVLSVVRSVTGQPIPVEWTNERIPHRHLARETIAESPTNWSPATQLEDGIARCWAAARGV